MQPAFVSGLPVRAPHAAHAAHALRRGRGAAHAPPVCAPRRAAVRAVAGGIPRQVKVTREVVIDDVMETPGGYIIDARVTKNEKLTTHTVIVGKKLLAEICKQGGVEVPPPEVAVRWVFNYFIDKNMDVTNTEGLLDVEVFPVNYFALRQVFYFHKGSKDALVDFIRDHNAAQAA